MKGKGKINGYVCGGHRKIALEQIMHPVSGSLIKDVMSNDPK